MAATAEDRLRAQAHTVGLLNEVEAVLTRALGYDQEKVAKLTRPLYELCDRDKEPRLSRGRRTSGLYPHTKKRGRK